MTGFYMLTGLRSELLEIQKGKIKPGHEAQLIVYNHRQMEGRGNISLSPKGTNTPRLLN